ncbi:hypothetical protein COO60DRAFT_370364 [Scenedesmus sp. NREL 46B-D3]|nr:hypothetical protein COO60DRAFT_370364 [Scenedesmus sp. NREL 46B-D3]
MLLWTSVLTRCVQSAASSTPLYMHVQFTYIYVHVQCTRVRAGSKGLCCSVHLQLRPVLPLSATAGPTHRVTSSARRWCKLFSERAVRSVSQTLLAEHCLSGFQS